MTELLIGVASQRGHLLPGELGREVTSEKIGDDYWNQMTITDVAWFLSSGQDKGVPKISDPTALEELHVAAKNGFTVILNFLIDCTYVKRGPKNPALPDFSGSSMWKVLREKKSILKKMDPRARSWLEGGLQKRPRIPSVLKTEPNWYIEWTNFLTRKGLIEIKLSAAEHSRLHTEFQKKEVLAWRRARASVDIDRATTLASNKLRDRANTRAKAQSVSIRLVPGDPGVKDHGANLSVFVKKHRSWDTRCQRKSRLLQFSSINHDTEVACCHRALLCTV